MALLPNKTSHHTNSACASMHRDEMCAHGCAHASIAHIPAPHHLALFWGLTNTKLGLKYHIRAQGRSSLIERFNSLHTPYLMGASAAEILIKHLSSENNDYHQTIQNIIIPSHYK